MVLLVEGLHVDAKVGDRDSFLFAGVMVRGATLEEVGVQAGGHSGVQELLPTGDTLAKRTLRSLVQDRAALFSFLVIRCTG